MEKRDQRFVIKCLWLRGERPRQIQHELFATLGSTAYSEHLAQCWVARFVSPDASPEDISRAGGPFTDLAEPLRLFLDDSPVATARMLSRHFNASGTTVKQILARDRGLRKFT
jgi:hypothetical protein